jgi:peptidoglycan/LPS O-acetylase OafA/YrhL
VRYYDGLHFQATSPIENAAAALSTPLRPADYRPDIDGLRAFSILCVLIFHYFPAKLPGGFIGVDIFFVISGYLISGIIFKSLSTGAFSFFTFYARRVRRIFPALIVVLIATLLSGWLFLFPFEWRQLGEHVFAGAAFVSNIVLMGETGYFNAQSNRPLLHLWSLGIEEQFYIVWPLLLVLVWKKRSATLPSILVVLSVSFALNLWYIGQRPLEAFYFPATRFWELALGALLAYGTMFRPHSRVLGISSQRFDLSPLCSLVGLSLLLASLVFITENRAFPGAWALLPTTGAFLTIAAGPKAWFNRVLLSSRPMVFLGLISYPLYLWHWPILFFARLLSPAAITWPIAGAALLASLTLSCLTYTLVESPLRRHPHPFAVPCLLAIVMGAIGLFGMTISHYKVGPRLHPDEDILNAIDDWSYPFDFNLKKADGFRTGQIGGQAGKQVLFIGDSHVEQYYSRVIALMEQHPGQLPTSSFATYGGCPPFPGVNRIRPGYACDKFFDYAIARAGASQVSTVVFSAWWEMYFGYESNGNKVSSLRRIGDGPRTIRPSLQMADLTMSDFGRAIRSLTTHGKRVFVILSNPAAIFYNPLAMVSRITGVTQARDLDRGALQTTLPIIDRLRAVSIQSGATVIDPVPYLCGESVCRTTTDSGLPMYKDNDHLRSSYVARYATFIDQIYSQ